MAEFSLYHCTKCGYGVQTEPSGSYGLMSGMYYNFACSHCEEIVAISMYELEEGMVPTCPNCKESGCLSPWNPVDGYCPKCKNEKMNPIEGLTIQAD